MVAVVPNGSPFTFNVINPLVGVWDVKSTTWYSSYCTPPLKVKLYLGYSVVKFLSLFILPSAIPNMVSAL